MSDNPFDHEHEEGYGLVMPFVVCKTNDGPYDDESYACGWEMAVLDERLKIAKAANAVIHSVMIHAGNLPQLELVLMKFGILRGEVEGDDDPEMVGWLRVELRWL